MFDHVLLPLDTTPRSLGSVPYGLAIAGHMRVPVTVLRVVEGDGPAGDHEQVLAEVEAAGDPSSPVSARVETGDPAEAILEEVEGHPDPLIVMATRAHGALGEILFGSVTSRVLRETGHPLLLTGPGILPHPRRGWPRRMLVCLDGSAVSAAILPLARRFALGLDLSVVFLHVIYPLVDPRTGDAALSREEDEMFGVLADTAATWSRSGIRAEWVVEQGTWPAESISGLAASRDFDVIAMATHGRTALARLLTGSTTAEVVRRSTVPILTLRPAGLH